MEPGSASVLGVLVVGTGAVAGQHLAALTGRSDATLVGVVDADAGRAEDAGRANGGVRWTSDLAEALAWPEVDACIVCTPNDTHADIGAAIARAGKHLLVEKPLATTVSAAVALDEAFRGAGTILMPAHTHRHYDYARTVKEVLAGGSVGDPRLVRIALLGGWIWPDWHGWMLDSRKSGGHALHNGVHLLDLVRWWTGRTPVSVYARGQHQTAAGLDIHDYLEMVVVFDGGAVAVCEMSRAHRPASSNLRDVLVVGTSGRLDLTWDAEGVVVVDERGTAALPAAGPDGFAAQLDAWLAAIRGGPAPVSSEDGIVAVAMAEAAERSLATGNRVLLTDVLEKPQ
jgi:predicted dehydrogenase